MSHALNTVGLWNEWESAVLQNGALRNAETRVEPDERHRLIPYRREALQALIGVTDELLTALADDLAGVTAAEPFCWSNQ